MISHNGDADVPPIDQSVSTHPCRLRCAWQRQEVRLDAVSVNVYIVGSKVLSCLRQIY